ncbi:MAG TPA: DUF4296 domain-containing protein [Flavisolibacter sp.]|nr:DUF4296 domain-containing protein [Flavisolibacter sp.]
MKKGFLVFTVLISLVACESGLPKNVVAPEKMEAVMWDMIQVDEMAGYYASVDSSMASDAKRIDNYQAVLRLHGLSREQLKTSLRYYQANPALLKPILDSLQVRSERLEVKDTLVKKRVRSLEQ